MNNNVEFIKDLFKTAEKIDWFIDPQIAFEKCFDTDTEREQYMYMYSEGNMHYFKHIDTRQYKIIKRDI